MKIKGSDGLLHIVQPTGLQQPPDQEPPIVLEMPQNGDQKHEGKDGKEREIEDESVIQRHQRMLMGEEMHEEVQAFQVEESTVQENVSNGMSENKRLQVNNSSILVSHSQICALVLISKH